LVRRIDMKRTIIALLTVATLVMMMLPADIEAARGGRGHGPAATNETIESLVADFDFDIPECPLCEGVMFTDRSSGGASPYTYDWDFGDGSNSTEENPRHGYADYGNYTVTLTVTDSASDVASEIKTITVAPQETTVEPFGSDISTTGATGTWPRCISGCTANDASITYIWLEANPSCTPGANTSAELWATFEINRSHGVCCLVSVVDIYVDGHFVDDYVTRVGDFLSAGTYDVKIADVIWPCGSVMTLRDIYAQWIPKGGQPCPTCDGNCDDYDIPSKCYYDPGPYEVPAPLIADFDYEGVCFCDDCNTSFTDTTTGGVEPYTSWYWDFGDSSGTSTEHSILLRLVVLAITPSPTATPTAMAALTPIPRTWKSMHCPPWMPAQMNLSVRVPRPST
jgi:PKD repeat protein